MNKYRHYHDLHITIEKFNPIKNDPGSNKPKGGLWSSPVDPDGKGFGWDDFCEAERWYKGDIEQYVDFYLTPDARILEIKDKESAESLPILKGYEDFTFLIIPDFEKLAQSYDAILFTETKYTHMALYGWDCDTLLVMNYDVIYDSQENLNMEKIK